MPQPKQAPAAPARRQQGPLRIVIVDDHPIVRKGLTQVISDEPDMTVCAESDNAAGALTLIGTERPDVAIVDLALGQESGLELVKAIAASHPGVRVLVLSMHDELLFAERALRAGASGYIMKHESMRDLLTAVRQVASGKTYISERVSERILGGMTGRRVPGVDVLPLDRLTDRERQVLDLIGRGLGTRDIAEQLHVSVKTIESHYAHIKEKLDLKSARELVRLAVSCTQLL